METGQDCREKNRRGKGIGVMGPDVSKLYNGGSEHVTRDSDSYEYLKGFYDAIMLLRGDKNGNR